MLSIGKVASAAAAGSYFGKDDYYARSDDSPSAWLGRGSAMLGLEGAVDRATFTRVLDGYVPGEEGRVGFEKAGEWQHRPGWDLTFKAPKSVSILAEVMGDDRLIAAHDAAVTAAVAYAEERHAVTRVHTKGSFARERTGSLVAASFRHDLSRNADPLVHTHVVVANLTATDRGWRSLHPDPLYEHAKEIGVVYQQHLALGVRALGYEVERQANATFEVAGVDDETRAAFSTRRAEIEAKLRGLGIDRKRSADALCGAG